MMAGSAHAARGTVLLEALIAVALVVLAAGMSFSVLRQSDARAESLIEGRRALDIASLVFSELAAGQTDPAALSGPVEQLLDEGLDSLDDAPVPWYAGWEVEVSLEDAQFPGMSTASVRVLRTEATENFAGPASADPFQDGSRTIATYHRLVRVSDSFGSASPGQSP